MRIIADAFGGDNAPKAVIEGCILAKKKYNTDIVLCGNETEIKKCATENNLDISEFEILHADEVMTMHDDPKDVLKAKRNSSMAVGLDAVASGIGDGFISAGSTGALVIGSTFLVKRIKGIKRAALGSEIPTIFGKYFFLMDEGANVECRPEMLQQFGIMASIYVENTKGIKKPRVGLLNVGTEETKGGELQLSAYKLLKESGINFIGNVEARDLMLDVCDVVVADGFSGNVYLKTAEGTASAILKMLKKAFTANLRTKIAAALVMPQLKELKNTIDYKKIGGAPVIGVKKPVFKAHGNSDADAFCSAIGKIVAYTENNVVTKLENAIGALGKTEDNG